MTCIYQSAPTLDLELTVKPTELSHVLMLSVLLCVQNEIVR